MSGWHEAMPGRTVSSDSMTLHSLTLEQTDPEVRLQIQSNIRVLYEPNVAPLINIATCRGHDGLYMAFLVKQNDIAKALSPASCPISSSPRSTRAGAMMSLLEATETRTYEILFEKSSRSNSKKSLSKEEPNIIPMPGADRAPSDYGERPKERDRSSLNIWRKQPRGEKPHYVKGTCIE